MRVKIKIPIYFGELIIIQESDQTKLKKKYRMEGTDQFDAYVFRDHKDGYTRYVMVFKKPTTFKIIAHESMHFVSQLFHDRGMIMDTENDEPQAYLLGWVVGECLKYLEIKSN